MGGGLVDGGGGGQLARDADFQLAFFNFDLGQLGILEDIGELTHQIGVDLRARRSGGHG
jgi:hypothetical protein